MADESNRRSPTPGWTGKDLISGVLSSSLIKERLTLPIENPQSFVFTPLLRSDHAFDADALDVRLGTYFLLPKAPPEPFSLPGSKSSKFAHQRVHVPLGSFLVVPAHQTVLGSTLEFIKLPYDVSGQILTKSSVARTFVIVETAPWIHPSYRGCLTLEIANVSNTPLLLYPGRLVAQLVLLSIGKPEPPSTQKGTYVGPIYPEAPSFATVEEELKSIGVTRRPRKPTF